MSILLSLYKQSLISAKNNNQLALLQNSARKLHMLGTHQGHRDFGKLSSMENVIDMENVAASTELSVINAELGALRDSSSLDYFA